MKTKRKPTVINEIHRLEDYVQNNVISVKILKEQNTNQPIIKCIEDTNL